MPEFDSPAIFARMLDHGNGGHFSIRPAGEFESSQRYLPDTNVVETIFSNRDGKVRLLDAFTVTTEEKKREALFPDHEILRVVENISGKVRMRVEYAPKIFYGKRSIKLKDYRSQGIQFSWREGVFILTSTLEPGLIQLSGEKQTTATAEFTLRTGEQVIFSLSYSGQCPAVIPELKFTGWKRMEGTITYWKTWISKCLYNGLYKAQVKRSALVLKLLTHAPSGAIIAAPTTSLPEEIGGTRNWDYRYCWLRDASFTIRALIKLGYEEEAHAYMNWILHATQLTHPELQVVYTVYGHAKIKETDLEWLQGYKHSKPVRIGNDAYDQFQLDVYGEVLDAFYAYSSILRKSDRSTRKFIIGLGEMICKLWQRTDNGIWEVRSSPVHHTHSKVMAWAGLDRLIRLCSKYNWKDANVEKYKEAALAIRSQIETQGYSKTLKSYTSVFNGTETDASLLTLPLVGYCDADAPRMRSTVDLIRKQLGKNKLLYRYRRDDGLSGSEGLFAICSFWFVENLARCGKIDEAMQVFELTSACSGPSGLISEEIHSDSNELLGNYPQGFSHIGLINAALTLESCRSLKSEYEYI